MQLSAPRTASHSTASCSSRTFALPSTGVTSGYRVPRAWSVRPVERGASPRAASLDLALPYPARTSASTTPKVDWAGTVLAPSEDNAPSRVVQIHSRAEFDDLLAADPERLVVLMCKALSCRPCKAFKRKYDRASRKYGDVLFCEVFGDESKELRGMMMDAQVRVTPTFIMYRAGNVVHSHVGIKEDKLLQALQTQVLGEPLTSGDAAESTGSGLPGA
ncbi:hypothetical protein ACKKBG_A29820 [Auxenochlorella protothecoides x Auxenochlorella symbiontica]